MSRSYTELKQRYAGLSDDSLLDLWRQNTLTDTAQMALRAELRERGIPIPTLDQPAEQEAPSPVENNGKWHTVAVFDNPQQSHIMRALLESEGIPVLLADEHQIGMNWMMSLAMGGVRVQVPEAYVEQSLGILEKLQAGELRVDFDSDAPEQK